MLPQVFESLGSFQKAFQIGPLEAKASMNLLKEVDHGVGDRLMQLCRFGEPVQPLVVQYISVCRNDCIEIHCWPVFIGCYMSLGGGAKLVS